MKLTRFSSTDLAADVLDTLNGLLADMAAVKATMPTVQLSGAQSKPEGNSGSTLFTFTVTRSATAGAVAVPWAFAPGSTSADDFTGAAYPAGGTVALADGVASGTFTISVNGDTTVETDETFTVSISAPAGYAAGSVTSATGTILNDDAAASAWTYLETFNKADAAIAAGGWGSTGTGGATWHGGSAGIASKRGVLAGSGYNKQVIDVGSRNMEVVGRFNVINGNHTGMVLRCNPDATGSFAWAVSNGSVITYDGSPHGLPGDGFPALADGEHEMHVVLFENRISLAVDGNVIVNDVASDALGGGSTGAGFQESGTGGVSQYISFKARVATSSALS